MSLSSHVLRHVPLFQFSVNLYDSSVSSHSNQSHPCSPSQAQHRVLCYLSISYLSSCFAFSLPPFCRSCHSLAFIFSPSHLSPFGFAIPTASHIPCKKATQPSTQHAQTQSGLAQTKRCSAPWLLRDRDRDNKRERKREENGGRRLSERLWRVLLCLSFWRRTTSSAAIRRPEAGNETSSDRLCASNQSPLPLLRDGTEKSERRGDPKKAIEQRPLLFSSSRLLIFNARHTRNPL